MLYDGCCLLAVTDTVRESEPNQSQKETVKTVFGGFLLWCFMSYTVHKVTGINKWRLCMFAVLVMLTAVNKSHYQRRHHHHHHHLQQQQQPVMYNRWPMYIGVTMFLWHRIRFVRWCLCGSVVCRPEIRWLLFIISYSCLSWLTMDYNGPRLGWAGLDITEWQTGISWQAVVAAAVDEMGTVTCELPSPTAAVIYPEWSVVWPSVFLSWHGLKLMKNKTR